jgi:hemerythrin-like domain-containing protein
MPPVQIGSREPGASFEQPFDMLAACHERIQRTLSLLQRLVQYLHDHGCDEQARDAARDVMRYFDLAAPAHHLDEERHVFPALEASGDSQLRGLAAQLRHDHEKIAVAWSRLRPMLQEVVEASATREAARFAAAARVFIDLNTAHLVLEDQHAFRPAHAAVQALGPQAVRAMGEEMAQRRGAPLTPPAAPGSR